MFKGAGHSIKNNNNNVVVQEYLYIAFNLTASAVNIGRQPPPPPSSFPIRRYQNHGTHRVPTTYLATRETATPF